MRLIAVASTVFVLAIGFAISQITISSHQLEEAGFDQGRHRRSDDGLEIFRFDTFGDEQLWTDVLRMHDVLPAVDPMTALSVGLKVDVEALPRRLIAALRRGDVDLTDPAVTVELLRLNAVVGIKGTVEDGQLTRVGITCALCHSTVDDSFAEGIGRRLDGWANIDLNVGAIVNLSPSPLIDDFRDEFADWGPGKYDPRHHAFDGTALIPLNTPSVPIVIPPIYGLQGVGFETYTGDGPISYWNQYVGVGQMGGQGSFFDPRIGLVIRQRPDLVAPKLRALLEYQLSLRTPPPGSFDRQAARRGRRVFRDEARCSSCHQGSTFTDVLSGRRRGVPVLHEPAETGMDPTYALRSATKQYRTTPLRGLQHHPPYFHDGSAPDLPAVVEHYDQHFGLNLTDDQKSDLVEYLKSL
jgi:hypothetical protein